jgi:SAM-dependent methyltransferase
VHDVEYRTSDDGFEYHHCTACNVLFLPDPPADRLAEIYPTTYYAYAEDETSIVQRAKAVLDRRQFKKLLAGIPGSSLAALDVGGGDGWMLNTLRSVEPRIRRTVVVDLDASAKARAEARGHESFVSRIEDFDDPGPFDVVLLLNLIEHVADPGAVLRRLASLLSPGGVILVKTPNVDSLDARLFRHRDWGGYHCPRHWVLFDEPSFVALAQRSGLRARRVTFTQGAPFWTVSVLAALARRRPATITPERPVFDHPLFGPLAAGFAAFDLVRSKVGAKPSQMFVELVRA